ncbi:MAG TPA: crosslink repair DNA glycosylase YcaQ family protein [Candidatus Limnocylindrales bacterium]|nr:crosslink repair DNA glycosylase YcaQ family protein [Candidatus Limnocylindrales bacterium]
MTDGFLAGAWKIRRKGKAAALLLEPFAPLATSDRPALEGEGERLLRRAEDEDVRYDMRWED